MKHLKIEDGAVDGIYPKYITAQDFFLGITDCYLLVGEDVKGIFRYKVTEFLKSEHFQDTKELKVVAYFLGIRLYERKFRLTDEEVERFGMYLDVCFRDKTFLDFI